MNHTAVDLFLLRTGFKLLIATAGGGFICSVVADGSSLATGIGDTSAEAIADAVAEVKKLLQ